MSFEIHSSRSAFGDGFSLRFLACVGVLLGFFVYPFSIAETDLYDRNVWGIERHHIANSITAPLIETGITPESARVHVGEERIDVRLRLTIDSEFNEFTDKLLHDRRHKPAFAAILATDPETGRILAMSSQVRDGEPLGNLALHSEFPAASLFKIITAAALLEEGKASPNSYFKYNGKSTALYKRHVLRHKDNAYTRKVTFKQAFATSINPVFGRLGIFKVGGRTLHDYGNAFGFNTPLNSDINVGASVTKIDLSDPESWSIAEAASGFTKDTTISPLHAASIVAAIVNDGVMVTPHIVEAAFQPFGPIVYHQENSAVRVVSAETAKDMRVLMRETVRRGSAKSRFRGFFKGAYANLDVGGKTGSLRGINPRGSTRWFAGYGDSGDRQIAIAAVVVDKDKWYVKPASLVRESLEEYFRPKPADASVSGSG